MKPQKSPGIPRLIGATAVLFCSFSQLSCREWEGDTGYSIQERQLLEPAINSTEWLQRLETDLKTESYFSKVFSNLYAELPPIDQWPAISEGMEKIANDHAHLTRLLSHTGGEGKTKNTSEKLLLFSALLKDGDADVEPRIRILIEENEIRDYRREEALAILLMTSKDREATLEWLKKTKPAILEQDKNTHSRDKEKQTDWEKSLAENKVDEGIALLKTAIEKEAERDEKSELYQKLIRIALVLDRKPLAAEATAALTDLLIAEIKAEERASSYSYEMVFNAPALGNEWQSVVDTFRRIAALPRGKDQASSWEFGHMDGAYATYLTALHKLGKTGDFSREIQKAQLASKHDPEKFFDLLAKSAAGQQPLGILYMDFLKASGEKAKALDHALHLLARNSGIDAFYAYLLDLDAPRAKAFIGSLRAYDPFEERPLIWMAEIARLEGNLEIAQKTIDEAIALDPSDGDHGKDTRMFCYEILARIHSDAGRAEEAAKFRSIVDSIRQGEAADDFLNAGLIKEATDRYKKALGQFENAYCLQSRLAMTLARNGKFDEAAVHFKKAFELMPVSFGPRESHCFGCEGLFNDPRVIEIALPLLSEFEKGNPENARAPYLLGLVLSEKKENAQAILAYRRALEIEPDYYNAALKLLKLLEVSPGNFTESETLREQIFGFAPYPEKAEYIPGPSKLRPYWELTADFPPSPLDLPAIPFAPAPGDKDAKAQYVTRNDYSFHNPSDRALALDGWSPSELRRANKFLESLDEID